MLKLYGYPVSNYYNVVKLALLEKGMEFEEVNHGPSQEEGFLCISPMGKMPAIETPEGPLCETLAILEYVDKSGASNPLFPAQPYQAGRAQQIHCMINNYLDTAVRPHIPAAYFGAPRDEEGIKEMNESLEKACKALARVVKFSPFIAGENFTHADLAAINTAVLASAVPTKLGQPDPVMAIPGFAQYLAKMEERDSVKQIRSDQAKSLKALLAGA